MDFYCDQQHKLLGISKSTLAMLCSNFSDYSVTFFLKLWDFFLSPFLKINNIMIYAAT